MRGRSRNKSRGKNAKSEYTISGVSTYYMLLAIDGWSDNSVFIWN